MALKGLKMVNVERVGASLPLDKTKRGQVKIIAAIGVQKAAVEHDSSGKDPLEFKPTNKKGEAKQRFSRWFWQSGGKFYTQIRYGQRAMKLDGKNSTIEAGTKFKDLLEVYDAVVDAVQKGELDKVIEPMSTMPGRTGKKGK